MGGRPYVIQRSIGLGRGAVSLKLEDVNSRTQAKALQGGSLTVPEEMVPLPPEGEYYHYQIMDMQVYTNEREYLGRIAEIFSTGTNDVYVVRRKDKDKDKELLIPALEEVVLEVDTDEARMTVDLPEGLRTPG